MSQPPPPPGWYPDPWRQAPWRWWDGRQWTGHVSQPRPAAPWLAPHVAVDAERGPTHWLRIAILVEAALFIPQLLATGAEMRDVVEAIRDDDDLPAFTFSFLNLFGLVTLAITILRLVWLMRAAEAGKRLGRPARREPGLAGAGWIIPVVNFWWPYQDVKALVGPDHPDRARVGWWWALHITGQVSVFAVIGTAFAPYAVQLAVTAVGAMAFAAAALIERDLVGDIFASHEELRHSQRP